MRAVVVPRAGEVTVADVPRPVTARYEGLVRVRACGLCNSTDLKIIDDHLPNQDVPFPVVPGHEPAGEIVEVGSAVRSFAAGDAVAGPLGRLGPGSDCTRMWGGMAEYAIVQDRPVMAELGVPQSEYMADVTRTVPADMSPEHAALLLTLKEARSALDNFGFRAGMDVLVWGDGPVGLALVKFLRLAGAGWVGCIGHWDKRLKRIAQFGGADLTLNSKTADPAEELADRRVDLAIDAVGSTGIIMRAARMLKQRGKVGVYGVLGEEDATLSLVDLPNNTAVHMLNWPHGEHEVHQEVVQLAREGTIDLNHFYSHAVPLEEAARAVEMVRTREAFKVIFTM
ncbi:MAG: alcohol dehydrogenase catalytic domain-containing protein [Candidatus Brocadiia bacterium]